MPHASRIIPLRGAPTVEAGHTARLEQWIAHVRQIRKGFHLTKVEFDEILRWKLGDLFSRQEKLRASNTNDAIRFTTRAAFAIESGDFDYELEVRVGLLTALPGVGVPVAAAVLAICEPRRYAVLDSTSWEQLFGKPKRSFTINDYKKFMQLVHRLAANAYADRVAKAG